MAGTLAVGTWLCLACVGLFIAGTLSLGHLLDLPVPCGAHRGCAAVASHPSSSVFGVPVAFFGVAAYAMMIWLVSRSEEAWARRAAFATSLVGAAVSLWLTHHAATVIGATCPWCIASAVVMALLAVVCGLVWWLADTAWRVDGRWVAGGAIVTSLLLGGQSGWMQAEALRPPVPAAVLAPYRAARLVDPAKALGLADAPVTVVVFSDMWCPACRQVHEQLVELQRRYPDRLRVAFRHLPLITIPGHHFSASAAAIGEIAAERGLFWEYVEAVFALRGAATTEELSALLERLGLDPAAVDARLDDPSDPAKQRVLDDMALASELGIAQTPTFIVMLGDEPPMSATQRTLPVILGSAVVGRLLAEPPAAAPATGAGSERSGS